MSERAIVQLVKRQQASLDIDAAFTSLSGLNKNGISGMVSGVDGCAAQPPIAGLGVPDGLYTPPNTSPNANNYIDGNPDNAPEYMGPTSPGSSAPGTANGEVDIDWASIVDGSAMTPDYPRQPIGIAGHRCISAVLRELAGTAGHRQHDQW